MIINLDIVISCIGILAEILSGSAFCVSLKYFYISSKLTTGVSPTTCVHYIDYWSGDCTTKKDSDTTWLATHNFWLFINTVRLYCAIFSFAFVLIELLLMRKADFPYLNFFYPRVNRGVMYIIKALISLGISADLGIAAGSIEIITGCLYILIWIWFKTRN